MPYFGLFHDEITVGFLVKGFLVEAVHFMRLEIRCAGL
ncbi:hypothetical protein GGR95_001494 [Sulfitobacter undariae]|uniref:Uncharacterized protein n=1 Tax=Sulfitobacter undariae TaxID=1563671 RepID=A0A7W6E329_9RHOB|nr:hypothetical protein [Sulfitobacter undariae]